MALKLRTRKKFALFIIISIVIDTFGRPIPLPETLSLRSTETKYGESSISIEVHSNNTDTWQTCPAITIYICQHKGLGEIGEVRPAYETDYEKTVFCDFVYSYIENHVKIPFIPVDKDYIMIQFFGYQRYCWWNEEMRDNTGKPELYSKLKNKNITIKIVSRDCGTEPSGISWEKSIMYPTRTITRLKDMQITWLISRCKTVFDLVSRNEARILKTFTASRFQLFYILCFCKENIALLYHHVVKHQQYITPRDAEKLNTEIDLEELFHVQHAIHYDVLPWLQLRRVWQKGPMCQILKPENVDRDKPSNFYLQFPSNESSTTERNSTVNLFLCTNTVNYVPVRQANNYQQTLICSFVFSFLQDKVDIFYEVINLDTIQIQLYAMQRFCDRWENRFYPGQYSPYKELGDEPFKVYIHVYKCGVQKKTEIVGEQLLGQTIYVTRNKIPQRIEDLSFDWLIDRCDDVYELATRNYNKLNGTFAGREINRVICTCRAYIPLIIAYFALNSSKVEEGQGEATLISSGNWEDHSLSKQQMIMSAFTPSIVQWLAHESYPPNKTCEDDPLMLFDASASKPTCLKSSVTTVSMLNPKEDVDRPGTPSSEEFCNKNGHLCECSGSLPLIGYLVPAAEDSLSSTPPTTTTTATMEEATTEQGASTSESSESVCQCCISCSDDTEKCSKLAYLSEMFDKTNETQIPDISPNENLVDSGYNCNNCSLTREKRQVDENKGCQFVINEANTMTRELVIKEFVEVARLCGPDGRSSLHMNLEGYFLAVIEPSTPPKVVFIAKLRMIKNKKVFFTIGSLAAPAGSFDMTFGDDSVQTVSNDANNVLPDGKGYPMMLVLLDGKKGDLVDRRNFKLGELDGKPQPLILNDHWQNFIKKSTVDALVYGSQIAQDRCTIFETLVPQLVGKDYVIRDWEGSGKELDDYSISRCTDFFEPFQFNRFKLAPLTPNLANDCKNGIPLPTSYDWNSIAPLIPLRSETEEPLPSTSGCSTSQGKRAIGSIDVDEHVSLQLAKKLRIQGTVSQVVIPPAEIGQGMERNRELREVVQNTVKDPPQIIKFDDIVSFSDADVEIAKHSWANKVGLKYFTDSNVRKWLKMNHNKENPEESTFYCAFCDEFYDKGCSHDVCSSWERSKITKKEGVLHKGLQSKWLNNREISGHSRSEEHGRSVQWKIQSETAEWEAQLRSSKTAFGTFGSPQEKISYEATANLLRLVLWETKANVACNQHKSLHDLMFHVFGVNIGHHYSSHTSCAMIRESMATFIHKEIMKSFEKSKQPISLLIDAAVVGQNHMLFVGIQASEKANSDVYLAWVVELGSDTTAEGQWKAFEAHIRQNDEEYIDYLKQHILSLASDGASVYTGKHKSFWTYLKSFLGRDVPLFHCISHKIQLCYRKILDFADDEDNNIRNFLTYLENSMRLLFQFYQPAFYKRFHGLKEFVEAVGGIFTKIRRILETRWVTTEVVAIDALFKMYEYVVPHLERIFKGRAYACDPTDKDTDEDGCVVDKSFSDPQKERAGELASVLKSKMTVLVWKFLKDVTHALMEFSKESQRRGKTLLEVWDQVKSLKRTLTRMKDTELGPGMMAFLESVKCVGSDEETCSLDSYLDNNMVVRYRDVELENSETYVYYEHTKPKEKKSKENRPKVKKEFDIPEFSQIREFVLQSVLSQIDEFFPANMYENFDIFQPFNLPMYTVGCENHPERNPQNYELDKVAKINEFLKLNLDPEQLRNDWGNLIMSVACHDLSDDMRNDPAYVFWPNAMDTKDLRWTATTRKFVDSIMSVAVSTAVIESFFSVAAHIGDDSRRDLSMDAMRSLVLTRVNHRIPLRYTNIYPFAINFHVVDGKAKSDDETVRGRKEEDEETVIESLKSFRNRREF